MPLLGRVVDTALHPTPLNPPRRLAAAFDDLSGMVNTDLLLLLALPRWLAARPMPSRT
jgi:hypothetical protein